MLKVLMLLLVCTYLNAKSIEFLDKKVLKTIKVDGLKFTEISDITYFKDDIYYALSDHGNIFKLKININNDKIGDIKFLKAYRLRGKNGHFLPKRRRDSEGLALVKNGVLVSFERRDRIDLYSKKFKYKKRLKLPKVLKDMAKYDYSGTGFEALSYSEKWGFITAREVPFDEEVVGYHTIFSKNGIICRFKRDKIKSSLAELEVMKNGNFLALFRKFSLKKFSFSVKLVEIDINHMKDGICQTKNLITLTPFNDRYIDNYEGLTKIKDNIYLMVSDDNDNLFQRTILRLFKIKDN